MPLTETNELAGYYPSDEAAVARLEGQDANVNPAAKLIALMQVQVEKTERDNYVLSCQLSESKSQARSLRNSLDKSRAALEICRERNIELKAELAAQASAPAPRTWAESMQGKRF